MSLEQVAIAMEDDDDDDDDEDEPEAKKDDVNFDRVGNIKANLHSNHLPARFVTIGDSLNNISSSGREFATHFNKFREEFMKDSKKYPRQQRFVSLVDRRKLDNKNQTVIQDELVFFAPPSNCRTVEDGVHPFRFFDTVRACVIPEEDYTKKYKEAENSGSKADVPSLKTVTSMNIRKGLMVR